MYYKQIIFFKIHEFKGGEGMNNKVENFKKLLLKMAKTDDKIKRETIFKKICSVIKSLVDEKYKNFNNLNQFEENFIKKLPRNIKGSQAIVKLIYLLITSNFECEQDIEENKKTIKKFIQNIEENKKTIKKRINELKRGSRLFKLYCNTCFSNETSAPDNELKKFKDFLKDIVDKVDKIKKEVLIKFKEKERIKKSYNKEELKNICDMHQKMLEIIYEELKLGYFKYDKMQEIYQRLKLLDPNESDYVKKCDYLIKKMRRYVFDEIKKIKVKVSKLNVNDETKRIFKKRPKEIFNHYYIKYLNSNVWKWKSTNKQFKVKNTKVNVEVTPISEFLTGVKNIASMDRNNENAVNVWKNEVKSKDGKVLFSSLRHANTRGKKRSTKQILLAAAVQQYGLDKLKSEANKNKVWEVNLGNVQLMTNWKKIAKKFGENNLISSQMKTFNEFVDKDVAVELDETHIVHLKLKDPILFNFGMNEIHYNKILPIDDMRSENLKSFEKLFGKELPSEKSKNIFNKNSLNDINENSWIDKLGGKVGDYIKNNLINKESVDYKKIKNLSKQVLYIWHTTYGHGNKKNPGAIQSRLLALMNLIGYPVSFNCKSGKDRTGILAAEVNNLITSMEANAGEVPDPYKKLDTEERLNLISALESSNSEKIAQYNTGYKGLKVRYKKLEKRFGKVKGASRNAKS